MLKKRGFVPGSLIVGDLLFRGKRGAKFEHDQRVVFFFVCFFFWCCFCSFFFLFVATTHNLLLQEGVSLKELFSLLFFSWSSSVSK